MGRHFGLQVDDKDRAPGAGIG